MKKISVTKKRIALFLILLLMIESIYIIAPFIGKGSLENRIEKPLEERGIKNGVVIDNSKDRKDIGEEDFKKIKEDKKEKKDKSHYYTLDNIEIPKNGFNVNLTKMPEKGKNIDNIERGQVDENETVTKDNMPFGEYVVFYPTHQDDEVLWAGSAIRQAIDQRGPSHVFVALVTSGTGHRFFSRGKFRNMDIYEKAGYRNREFVESCEKLGVPKENIIFLYQKRSDWKTDFNIERDFALEMEKKYKSVTNITHSYKYDDHFMHRANGETLYKLWKDDRIKDLRFFVKPFLLKYVDATKNTLNIYTVDNQMEYNMIRNACRAYKYVNPEEGREGIGYRTDYMSFDKLVNDPYERSYIIIQNNKKEG